MIQFDDKLIILNVPIKAYTISLFMYLHQW